MKEKESELNDVIMTEKLLSKEEVKLLLTKATYMFK